MNKYFAIDLFSGCGGLSQGLRSAGFEVVAAFDSDADSIATYKLNHPDTKVFEGDIRDVDTAEIMKLLRENLSISWPGVLPARDFPPCAGSIRSAAKGTPGTIWFWNTCVSSQI